MLRKILLGSLLLLVIATAAASVRAGDGAERLADHPRVRDAIALLDLWIEEQRGYHDLPGLSIGVVHDRNLIWATGYGWSDVATRTPATPTTVYRIASITKLFTSVAVLQLRDQGRLRLDDPVVRHLPWFAVDSDFSAEPEITIRHLLTHTSGLPREAAFPYWTDHLFPTRTQLHAAVPTQAAIFAPATTYKYSNLGMALLGEIVVAVSGESYADYLDRHILRPLGMTNTSAAPDEALLSRRATPYMRRLTDGSRGVFDYYDTGALAPAANMVSTVEDLTRFAALQLAGGGDGGTAPVLRSSSLREMQRPHWLYDDWSGGRGLGFSLSRRQGKTFVSHGGWIGGNRSHLLLVPGDKIAVIVMTNADDANPSLFSSRIYDVLAPAIAAATTPPEEPRPAPTEWQRYVGTYSDPWGWQYRVLILNDKLTMYDHSYPPEDDPAGSLSPLEPVAEHIFRLADGELVVFEMQGDVVERVKRRYDYLLPLDSERPPADDRGRTLRSLSMP